MNPEQMRIKIAEACGIVGPWETKITPCGCDGQWDFFNSNGARLPDYPNDLNAMHEAEKIFDLDMQTKYLEILCEIVDIIKSNGWWTLCHATAAQRAEAFLKTIGKWEDDK